MEENDQFLNKEAAALHLKISTKTLDRRIKKGTLTPIKKKIRGRKWVRFIKQLLPDPPNE